MSEVNLHEVFNNSFDRCKEDPEFIERFYQIFFSKSDEIKEKFKNTAMEDQKKMLLHSIPFVVAAYSNADILEDIAESHNAGNYNIKPELYSLWLDSMIEAVWATDKRCDKRTEQAWRAILKPGIDFMISKYHKP